MAGEANLVEFFQGVVEENRRLREENDRLKRDIFRGIPARIVTIGCARVAGLLRMDEGELARFDSALRGFLAWVLSMPNGADDLTDGRFSAKFRDVLRKFDVGYMDGIDDRRWNVDLKSTELSAEQRLRAYVSDRRYWIFQATHANHETVLAADTMVKLCEWRQIFD